MFYRTFISSDLQTLQNRQKIKRSAIEN